jgi:Transposase DDE domain
VAIFTGRAPGARETYTAKMKRKIDSSQGCQQYSRRLGIVEPVFTNLCHNLGRKRFSPRGRVKVNI